MTGWFAVQRLREGVYLVGEPMHVNNYLIVGSRRAVLFDSGLGISDIRNCVEKLTDKPVMVVNSHHHFDHVGGNELFDDIAIHHAGAPRLLEPFPDRLFEAYAEFAAQLYQQYLPFREMDDAWFQVLAPEMQLRPFPADFDAATWRIAPSTATRLLADGDELDLGDRVLRVVHTPGHSPDGICLIDSHERLLLAGDTVNTGAHYAHFAESSVTAFAESTALLAREWAGSIDTVLAAHGGRYLAHRDLVFRVAEAMAMLAVGDPSVEYSPTVDIFGTAARQARFGDFSVVVPLGAANEHRL